MRLDGLYSSYAGMAHNYKKSVYIPKGGSEWYKKPQTARQNAVSYSIKGHVLRHKRPHFTTNPQNYKYIENPAFHLSIFQNRHKTLNIKILEAERCTGASFIIFHHEWLDER